MAAPKPISPNSPGLSFGPFTLDPASGELRKAGTPIKLQPQPFRLLLLLAERAGTVVTRDDIQKCLWSDSTFVDFEHGINFSINQIRGALGDNSERPRYIETLPRRGYRFIAPLQIRPSFDAPSHTLPVTEHRLPQRSKLVFSEKVAVARSGVILGRRPIEWAVTGVLLLFVGAFILRYNRHHPSYPLLPDLKLRQLTLNPSDNPANSGAISPDGKYLAFSDSAGMHIQLISTGETRSIPAPEGLGNDDVVWEIPPTAWFPDSTRFLANAHPAREIRDAWSSSSSSVWTVSLLAGAPHRLRDHAVSWSVSPDGTSVSFSSNPGKLGEKELWLMGHDGERAHKLFEVAEPNAVCCLRFFPNTPRISYVATGDSGSSLLSREIDGGPVTLLLPPSALTKMGDFSFFPDGRLLYSDLSFEYSTAFDTPINYWIEGLNPQSGRLIEAPRRLTNWAGSRITNSSISADGRRIAFLKSSGRGLAYLADLNSAGTRIVNPRRFTKEEGGEDALAAWTADGKTAILVQNRGDRYAIYKQGLASDSLQPVVPFTLGGLNEDVVPSPDGRWLILQIWPVGGEDQVQILRAPFTGGTPEPLFKVNEGSAIACARPPSKLCAVAEHNRDHTQMIVTSFDSSGARGSELARFDLRDQTSDPELDMLRMDISPDGSRLAVVLGPYGPIAIRPLQSQHTDLIYSENLNRIRLLRWAAGGKALVVSSFVKGSSQILRLDLSSKTTTLLWKCEGENCFALPSPDGGHLAIYTWKRDANLWMMENF
jgi:DNA-binding winged helix-turn-helix (wHTH) protein/Tol biopolymer transport system component